ncbi:MAG TPA: 50S ribosomal protein L14e [Candidatus Nanoarchaeia archaeon]|nr:50S ribosomal protein L14e [Candidatus Nanoarchaeia archaeon]
MIFEVGRLCVKIAGRDAGRTCVVVEAMSNGYVVVDGDVRRKKVNVKHLEPLDKTVSVKSKASSADVKKAFEKEGLSVWETTPKKFAERPKKMKAKKAAPVVEKAKPKKAKAEKAEAKAEEKKVEAPLEA